MRGFNNVQISAELFTHTQPTISTSFKYPTRGSRPRHGHDLQAGFPLQLHEQNINSLIHPKIISIYSSRHLSPIQRSNTILIKPQHQQTHPTIYIMFYCIYLDTYVPTTPQLASLATISSSAIKPQSFWRT